MADGFPDGDSVMAAPPRRTAGRDYRPVIGVGTLSLSAKAKQLVLQTLDQNRLSYGPLTRRFEHEFAQLHDCRFGVFSNSGTSSLHIALAALKELGGWRDGDEVLVPSVTFIASSNVVLHNNLTPVFVDVDREHYEIDPRLIEAKITPRTRAIIPVHLFGQPCDMDPIVDIARRHNLKILEDSCETMFARYKGRSAGALGDIACFSTYVAHLLVTGVGGLATTNDPEYAIMLRSLMNHGRDSIYLSIDDDDDKTDDELRVIVERRFRFVHVGHSFRATEMEAALGLAQLESWESMLASRRNNAKFLSTGLARWNDRMQLPAVRPDTDHSFMMYPITLREERKTDLVNYLERHGVETRDLMPLINQPVYLRKLLVSEADYPVARWVNANGFYIGCHQDLGNADLEYIVDLFDHYWTGKSERPAGGCSTLVVVLEAHDPAALDLLDRIPIDLFSRVIVLRRSEGSLPWEPGSIEEHLIGSADPLQYVRNELKGTSCEEIVFVVANGRQNVADAGKLLLMLQRGYDMVIASRFTVGGGRSDQHQRFPYRSVGNRLFTALANLAFYGKLTDATSPFFAIKRDRLLSTPIRERGVVGVFHLAIASMREDWRLAETATVEQRGPSQTDQARAWRSVIPLCVLLWREWRAAARAARAARDT